MKTLFLITARGGSKGIPKKNTKLFHGKPLIQYSIELALKFSAPQNICVSTDDTEVIKVSEGLGLKVPFVRPDFLATDAASSYDVILHALNYYESNNIFFDQIVLLQPTSPLRTELHLQECLSIMNPSLDMVVSVKDTVNGFIQIALSDKTIGEEINIATKSEISIGDLAQVIINQINTNAKIVSDDIRLRPAKSEVERLYGSNDKIIALTNWKQEYTFEKAIAETIEWFKIDSNLSKYKTDIYNV